MNLSTRVLGAHAVHKLEEQQGEAILRIGKDTLTREELAEAGCYNFAAARRLTAAIAEQLSVRSLKQLYDEIDPNDLALPGVGVICLAVLGAAWEAKGIGGEVPLENYVRSHRGNQKRELLTFDSIKRHEHDRQEAVTKTKRRRRA